MTLNVGHIDIPRPISATVSISVLINGLPASSTFSSDASINETEEPSSEEKKTSKANKTSASASASAESTHAIRVEIWNAHEAEQVAMGRDELSVPCLVLSGAVNAGLNRLPGTLSPRSTHHYP